jgi:hypothetical protein
MQICASARVIAGMIAFASLDVTHRSSLSAEGAHI